MRLERDGRFWAEIARHPDLRERLGGIHPEAVAALAARADVLPLAGPHGGFLFVQRCPLGLTVELHSLFTPEGRGRRAIHCGLAAFRLIWALGAQIVVTTELEHNPGSRPPRSFGFVPAGDWRETILGRARGWVLTRAAWDASPAIQRRERPCR